MSRDGKYAAWFRTSRGAGTGIVHLAKGRISGGDSFFTYAGSCEIDEDRFSATLTTLRHSPGPTTLFGADEVVIRLTGLFKGKIAFCSGAAEHAPGESFEATLFPSPDDTPAPEVERAPTTFKADKLPKGSHARGRTRNPFTS